MSSRPLSAFPLRETRVHEVCGPAAAVFAAIAAGAAEGSVLWVRESWMPEVLTPTGLLPFLNPSSLLIAKTRDQTESLAVAGEALKEGAVPFVVMELTRAVSLRAGRGLQLAAKDGGSTGLCIIPDGMGSNAAETRWHAAPVFDPEQEDSTLMRWEIMKNKSGTIGAWHVRWDPATRRLHVVPPVGQRPGSANLPE